MYMRLFIFTLLALPFILRCNEPLPSQPMTDNEFATIYAEYLFIISQDSAKKEFRYQYLETLLTQRGKTIQDFSETWDAFDARPEKWEKIMQIVRDKMQEKQRQIKEREREK